MSSVEKNRYAAGRTAPSAIIAAQCCGGSITTSVLVALRRNTGARQSMADP
jgi:hypothetical protein